MRTLRILAGFTLAAAAAAVSAAPTTELISKRAIPQVSAADGTYEAVVSGNGRYVAFTSQASDLVAGDGNDRRDIFVRDLSNSSIERISVSASGTDANSDSSSPAITADGRFVVFVSGASNLVPGDSNDQADLFVRDRQTGTTERVSVDSAGAQANNFSFDPALSDDGRFVAFSSLASNLVAGDTNQDFDIFVHDRDTRATTRVSVGPGGAQANAGTYEPVITDDGRFVAFWSGASNLVAGDNDFTPDVFLHDRQSGTTERVSVNSEGTQAFGDSRDIAISRDGRYVAFYSYATNLAPDDTNGTSDVFLRDRLAGTTERISVGTGGSQGNDRSQRPAISADGRYVTFFSYADNLVPGDSNQNGDVFVRDRQSATTQRVSVTADGSQGDSASYEPSISADGRYVAFLSSSTNLVGGDSNSGPDAFVRDRESGSLTLVSTAVLFSEAAGNSYSEGAQALSADGRYVVFTSGSSTLVDGDTNGHYDVFVRDRQSGTVERASVDSAGTQLGADSAQGAISADGRYVAFYSYAADPAGGDSNERADVFVRDRESGALERVSVDSSGAPSDGESVQPSISADGRYVAFFSTATNLVENDTNGQPDIFLRDRQAGTTVRISVDSAGTEADYYNSDPAISADGRYVAFTSYSSNLVPGDDNVRGDIFVHDRESSVTERVSVDSSGAQGDDNSQQPAISADGRFVSFWSTATNLVTGDTNNQHDVFVHDRQSGTTERVSVDSAGAEGNQESLQSSLSADGRYVAFESWTSNLVAGDTNATPDAFVHDRQSGLTERISLSPTGSEANGETYRPALSADGRYVAFSSTASNLGAIDLNHTTDVYLRDRGSPDTTAPVITPHVTGTPGANGWYLDEVSIDWTVEDAESSVSASTGCDPGTVNTETSGILFTCEATSAGGTSSEAVTVKLDKAAPAIAITTPSNGASYTVGQVVAASYSCSDVPSGIAACQGTVPNGAALDTASAGTRTFTVQAQNTAGHTSSTAVSYTVASAPGGNFSITPATAAYGNVAVNTSSAPQAFTVRNSGAASISIGSIVMGGTNPGKFTPTHNCGAALAAGATCTVNVVFRPNFVGAMSAVLRVTSGTASRSSSLTGAGVAAAATYTLTPATLTFGNQARDTTSAAQSVQVQNTGTASLPLTSIALSGANPGQFSRTTTCGATLAAGTSCQIDVVFAPRNLGARSATLTVNAGAGAGSKTVSVSGTAVASAGLSVTPATLTFPNQLRNTTSAPQTVTLSNPGTSSVNITRTLSGTNPGQFAQASTTCGASVPAGGSCTISVTFTPRSPGARFATLTIQPGGGASASAVSLNGQGT